MAQRLKNEIYRLINEGYFIFLTGGALGFDTMAAQTVLMLKKKHPHIQLVLILPCRSQSKFWSKESIEIYQSVIRSADHVVYTSEAHSRGCMFKRNRLLVDMSSTCVCYRNESSGGTAYTVEYAISKGISVINLAEKNADVGPSENFV